MKKSKFVFISIFEKKIKIRFYFNKKENSFIKQFFRFFFFFNLEEENLSEVEVINQ